MSIVIEMQRNISLVSSGSSQDKLQKTPLILSHAAKLCQAAIVLTAPTVPKADSGFSRFAKVSSDGSVLAPKRCCTWKRRVGDAASDCRRCGFSANEAPCCSQLSSPLAMWKTYTLTLMTRKWCRSQCTSNI